MTAAEFKAIRSKLGLSQSQLAAFLGLRSKSHVSRIENGKQVEQLYRVSERIVVRRSLDFSDRPY